MYSRLLTIAAAISLIVSASIGMLSAGVPTLYCPMPTLTVIPAFLTSRIGSGGFAVLLPALLFFLWNPPLLKGQSRTPTRSIVLVVALSGLTFVDFGAEWSFGVKYQGLHHTIAMLIINVVWLAVLWASTIVSLQRQSFLSNLASHWVLFLWLSWYAFPYMGELP